MIYAADRLNFPAHNQNGFAYAQESGLSIG